MKPRFPAICLQLKLLQVYFSVLCNFCVFGHFFSCYSAVDQHMGNLPRLVFWDRGHTAQLLS